MKKFNQIEFKSHVAKSSGSPLVAPPLKIKKKMNIVAQYKITQYEKDQFFFAYDRNVTTCARNVQLLIPVTYITYLMQNF